jgi:hypothetical protein
MKITSSPHVGEERGEGYLPHPGLPPSRGKEIIFEAMTEYDRQN